MSVCKIMTLNCLILVFYMRRQLSSIGKMHNLHDLQLYKIRSTSVDWIVFLQNIVVREHQIQYIDCLLDE